LLGKIINKVEQEKEKTKAQNLINPVIFIGFYFVNQNLLHKFDLLNLNNFIMKKNFCFYALIALIIASCESAQQKQKRMELRRADSIRVADSLNKVKVESLGMWQISTYVNEFGEPTKQKYIRNSIPIHGTFSNSASEAADLGVMFLIDSQNLSIQLFEYASSNPVKKGIEWGYNVRVKFGENEITELKASNYSDRLSLNQDDSKKLKDIFLRGGKVMFYIVERSQYSKSSYQFTINDVSGFANALKKLTE
jgi:hypothetical protein